MKMSFKMDRLILEVLRLIYYMVLLLMPTIYADNPCEDNIYLEVGTEGVVPCDFRDFTLLGWINGSGNYEETSPFIYLENSQRKGRGYTNGDYDMFANGSLVIKNVQFSNNRDYTALYVPFLGPQVYLNVSVRVFAPPDPEYPVINGFRRQQYIVQDVGISGSINCTLNGARPGVPLEWDYQSDEISMENGSLSNRSNADGSTNILLTSHFTITSQSVKRVMLKCKTAGELAYLFPLVTTIYLHVKRNYPIVNGQTSQHHVVVSVRQGDELNCSLNRVPRDVFLQWVFLPPEQSDGLLINNETSIINNTDGTFNITLTSSLRIVSPSVQHKTLQCIVIGQGSDLYPDVTTVDILFTQNYPIVNGHVDLHHVVIELKREDEFICSMNRVPHDVLLQWVLLTEEPPGQLMLQNETSAVNNEDGTANITLTSRFSVLSPSIQRVTLQCRVSGQEADRYPDFTIVDVLISDNFPVVNGHNSGQHVILHLKREDELNCEISSVSEDISLEWVIITPGVTDEMALEDKHSKTSNEDGTFDVRLSRKFSILDNAIQHVTMECRVLDESTNQYQQVTTVAVLITQNTEDKDSNISGWTLSLVIVALLILIALTCLTLIIAKYGRKSHKRIALIYSIQQEKQKMEREEGLPLHKRNMNGDVQHSDAPGDDDHETTFMRRCITVSPPDNDDHEGTLLRGRNDNGQIQRDNSHQVKFATPSTAKDIC